MYITSEQVYGKKIKVFADGEPIGTFDSSFWYSLNIYDGDEVSQEKIDEILSESNNRRAYQSAITYLSYRAYSKKDLFNKLLLKDYPREACEYAISRVEEIGLIDDHAYAELYATSLYQRKFYGKKRIIMELKKKGVDSEIAESAAEALDIDHHMAIINLLTTKYANNLADEKGKKRTFSALVRLGYEYDDIRRAFNEIGAHDDD